MKPTTINNNINAIKEVRKLFNEVRSNLLNKGKDNIRTGLDKKETVYNFLKEKEQEGSLTDKEKNVLKEIGRYIKNKTKYFKKKFKKSL